MKIPAGQENKDYQEYYGPIDGVLPIDYIETYALLIASICIKQINNEEKVYISRDTPKKRLCEECYENLGKPEEYKLLETKHTMHLVAHLQRGLVYRCCQCTKEVMQRSGQARHCCDCIEEFTRDPTLIGLEPEIEVPRRYSKKKKKKKKKYMHTIYAYHIYVLIL